MPWIVVSAVRIITFVIFVVAVFLKTEVGNESLVEVNQLHWIDAIVLYCAVILKLIEMCSFVYGYALGAPILGKYFQLPKKNPTNHKIIFDEDFKSITDVWWNIINCCVSLFTNSILLCFQVFAYRYINTEKYVVKDIHPFKSVDDLLETIKKTEPEEQNVHRSR